MSTTNPRESTAPNGGEPWVTFDDLSHVAKCALRNATDTASPAELEQFARRFQWQETALPTSQVIATVMACGDHVDYFGDWDAYHLWYLSEGGVPDHGESRWPCIETQPPALGADYLDDGWHRLHSYIRAGDQTIPVLRARSAQPNGGHAALL
jgi:hypothetical protein